jgi:SAM-dependent methyltransferase
MPQNVRGWWNWPNGRLWRWALGLSGRLRHRRVELFLRRFPPARYSRVLDVGASHGHAGASNALLELYPTAEKISACGREGEPDVCRRRGIRFIEADGCDLPFADGHFDVVHANAVIEHVGGEENRRRFVAELCRVGRCVWIATPDAAGPFEPHTLIPFAHWLPRGLRERVYRKLGRGEFADPSVLDPISAVQLRASFPRELRRQVEIRRQYLLALPAVLIAVLER